MACHATCGCWESIACAWEVGASFFVFGSARRTFGCVRWSTRCAAASCRRGWSRRVFVCACLSCKRMRHHVTSIFSVLDWLPKVQDLVNKLKRRQLSAKGCAIETVEALRNVCLHSPQPPPIVRGFRTPQAATQTTLSFCTEGVTIWMFSAAARVASTPLLPPATVGALRSPPWLPSSGDRSDKGE